MKNYTLKNRREFIRQASKIEHEWNGHLDIFSLPQAIEKSRQFLLLRTDILQKTVFGCAPDCLSNLLVFPKLMLPSLSYFGSADSETSFENACADG